MIHLGDCLTPTCSFYKQWPSTCWTLFWEGLCLSQHCTLHGYGFPLNCPAGAFDTEQTLGKNPEGTDEEDRQHRKHTFLRLHTRARRRKAGAPGLTHWPCHAQPQWLMPSLHLHPHRCTVTSTDTPITLTHPPHTGGESGVTPGASPADRKMVTWGTWPQEVTSWASEILPPAL